jgi:cytochrome c oxidase assembly protein subunit 15
VAAAAALGVLQIALGGLVSSSYAGLACPDWPTCLGGAWFPTWRGPVGLHLAHRMNGYALLLALGAAAVATRGAGGLGRLCALGLAVGTLQVAVGVANVWLHVPVEVTALHSALAAALVLLLTAAVRRTFGAPAR